MKNKNIHLIETYKASRGLVYLDGEYKIERGLLNYPKTLYPSVKGYNIYITDDSDIKDGDWVLDKFNQSWKLEDKKLIGFDSQGIKRFSTGNVLGHECKKIILTNNKDLIKDGVQEISEEFLEWFVKNPSCEWVEVEKIKNYKGNYLDCFHTQGQCDCGLSLCKQMFFTYKIILPKEDSKQKWDIDTCRYFDIEAGCEREKCICENITKEEPKQETLEEVLGSKMCQFSVIENKLATLYRNQVKIYNAINKQQERMYSEEDLHNAFYNGWLYRGEDYQFPKAKKEWFEQFKKK